ncbi:hypothetical protein [Kineosporia sp. A_224]|uniref:hypothetical protein n=1 Tax=Kineosporia sp. A_224 TaxID=1962180 RepID=UPI0018E9C27D|nr:hypothetical protein [Kineosporia sp. A_224]
MNDDAPAIEAWTGALATALQKALRLSNEAFAAELGVAPRTVAGWHASPDVTPSPVNQAALDTRLSRAPAGIHRRVAAASSTAGRDQARPAVVDAILVERSAREVSTDALEYTVGVGPHVLSLLRSRLIEVADRYNADPPAAVFLEIKAVRDTAVGLRQATRRPSELSDLHVVVGAAAALMGSMAFDLGQPRAAGTLARSATEFGDLAGHSSLVAWTFGLRATLAFWAGKTTAALRAIEGGLAAVDAGPQRVRLLYIAARAHAVAGDADAVAASLTAAARSAESSGDDHDELQDDIGGEFAFGPARADACAGAAWLEVGDGARAAAAVARTLASYELAALPVALAAGARLDLATALVMQGDLTGAAETLVPVLQLPAQQRSAALTSRMQRLRRQLRGHGDGGHPIAEATRTWCVDAGSLTV